MRRAMERKCWVVEVQVATLYACPLAHAVARSAFLQVLASTVFGSISTF